MIKKLFLFLISRYSLHKIVIKQIEIDKIKNLNTRVLNNGAKFENSANVYNIQNDSNKISIGKGSVIAGTLLVFKYGGRISIGNDCYVGDQSRIWSGENISIGNNVLISHNVNVIDTSAHELDYMERAERYVDLIKNGHWNDKGSIITAPIVIEDHVWISFNVAVLRGVHIGKGSIIAAGSIVTKNVPPNCVVAGNPAKVLRYLK